MKFKHLKIQRTIILIVILLLAITSASGQIHGQNNPMDDIEQTIQELSNEEAEALEKLFGLVMEIENIEIEQRRISSEIETLKSDLKKVESRIIDEEIHYEQKKDELKEVFRSYQRMGAGSYLEIILEANNLRDLLRRISIVRDLARKTNELLSSIKDSKNQLLAERNVYSNTLSDLNNKEEQLRISLDRTLDLKNEIEIYLVSLEGERDQYEERLGHMEEAWSNAKPLLSEIMNELSEIIEAGRIPQDAMKITITARGIRGVVQEKTFNDIIALHPRLNDIIISFSPGIASLKIPEIHLTLSGGFEIVGQSKIEYNIIEGLFFTYPLGENVIEELTEEAPLVFNFEHLIENNILRSLEINEEHIELLVIPRLFQ